MGQTNTVFFLKGAAQTKLTLWLTWLVSSPGSSICMSYIKGQRQK